MVYKFASIALMSAVFLILGASSTSTGDSLAAKIAQKPQQLYTYYYYNSYYNTYEAVYSSDSNYYSYYSSTYDDCTCRINGECRPMEECAQVFGIIFMTIFLIIPVICVVFCCVKSRQRRIKLNKALEKHNNITQPLMHQ